MKNTIWAALALAVPGLTWSQTVGYSGAAYGTNLTLKTPVSGVASGKTALSVLCSQNLGASSSNSTVGLNGGVLISTGAVSSNIVSQAVSGGTASVATAEVASVKLLGGLVKADGIKSVANAIAGSPYGATATGTTFANLYVAGIRIAVNPDPNTKINLPGIGYVVLNDQSLTVEPHAAKATVTALKIVVSTANVLLIPIGTSIEISQASASVNDQHALLSGAAWGTDLSLAGTLDSGRTALANLACSGNDGVPNTNSIVLVDIPGVLSGGTVTSIGVGKIRKDYTIGETSNTLAGLKVLNSLIAADAITADVSLDSTAAGDVFTDNSSFVNLTVLGHPEITLNPPPNTTIELAGLGTLTLHKVVQTPTSMKVFMIDLQISTASLGLPIGAHLHVGAATIAAVH